MGGCEGEAGPRDAGARGGHAGRQVEEDLVRYCVALGVCVDALRGVGAATQALPDGEALKVYDGCRMV